MPCFKKEVWRLMLILCVLGCYSPINADIIVRINPDTTKWAPVAYLSIIPDFSQTNTISYSNIIEQTAISENGVFRFQTKLLPDESHLYRIHISKKGDPPASLVIGGKSHNHFFLFAIKDIEIHINSESGESLFNELSMEGYDLNNYLLDINRMKSQLDIFDYYGTVVNIDFLRNSIFDEMRNFADTCSSPLAALYAIYQSDYKSDYLIHPDFYIGFLNKWKSEESLYFDSFRKQLGYEPKSYWKRIALGVIMSVMIALLTFLLFNRIKRRRMSKLSNLSIQERRIYALLKEGKANKEIANEYNISVSTVKSHVNSIYSKLGISSRKEILDHNNDA